jgi:hypothetical protein
MTCNRDCSHFLVALQLRALFSTRAHPPQTAVAPTAGALAGCSPATRCPRAGQVGEPCTHCHDCKIDTRHRIAFPTQAGCSCCNKQHKTQHPRVMLPAHKPGPGAPSVYVCVHQRGDGMHRHALHPLHAAEYRCMSSCTQHQHGTHTPWCAVNNHGSD